MERAHARVLKNRVGKTILDMVEEYPFLDSLFKVEKQQYIPRYNENGELQFLDPKFIPAENVMGTKKDGTQYFITVKDPILSKSLKNMNLARIHPFFRPLRTMLGVWSFLKTGARPEFLMTNFERDLGEAIINLGVEKSKLSPEQRKDLRKSVVRGLRGSYKRLWTYLGGNQQDAIVDEFFRLGGDVGHFWMETAIGAEKSMRELQEQIESKSPMNAFREGLQFVEKVNKVVELGVRFSTYNELVKRGFSKERAVQSAADLTINFSRQGEIAPILKAAYGFINPAIQGTSKVIRSVTSPEGGKRVMKSVLALSVFGFLMRTFSILLGGDEDDKISDWAKNHRIIFALPNGYQVQLWSLPYGYTSFYSLGGNAADVMWGKKTGDEALKSVMNTTVNSFSPFDTNLNSLIPTLAKPLFEIKQNKNWYDSPIYPAQQFTKTPKRDSETYFKSADGWSKFMAGFLNKMTGGNEHRAGIIDVHPGSMEYLYNQWFGGPFEFATSTFEAGARGLNGEFDPNKTPFVRQVVRQGKTQTFSYGVIYDTLERAWKKDISDFERDRFFRAVDIGLEEKLFDQKRANEFTRDFLKAIYKIDKITSYETAKKIMAMPEEDRIRLLKSYSERTRKMIGRRG